jgi:hypothetical protein
LCQHRVPNDRRKKRGLQWGVQFRVDSHEDDGCTLVVGDVYAYELDPGFAGVGGEHGAQVARAVYQLEPLGLYHVV